MQTQDNTEIEQSIRTVLDRQRQAYFQHPEPTYEERIQDLNNLAAFLRDHQEAICAAINQDFGNRSSHETLLSDILPTLNEIKHE